MNKLPGMMKQIENEKHFKLKVFKVTLTNFEFTFMPD